MHSSHHPDHPAGRPAADAPHHEGFQDLIARARGLREDAEALRGGEGPVGGPEGRGAAWEEALRRLDDFGRGLESLRPVPERERPRTGSAEWSLLTDAVVWSDDLYAIFGRPVAEGPLTLDQLPSCLADEDQPRLAGAVTRCLVDGQPAACEFRVARPDGTRRTVRLAAEPVLDETGSTVAMWAVAQEVAERGPRPGPATAATRRPAAPAPDGPPADRRRHDEPGRPGGQGGPDGPGGAAPGGRAVGAATAAGPAPSLPREATATPWQSPPERRPDHGVPRSLQLAARCLPADGEAAGDRWHDWIDIGDGSTVLSVGDLSGSGPGDGCATAGLLGALRGIALTRARPATVLEHLNDLMDRGTQPALAGLVCCRYRADDGSLTWAQAGHPAPLLCREGSARLLPRPPGTLLGAIAGTVYGERVDRLHSGDTLVLHTDGLFPPEPPGPDGRVGTARSSDPVLLTLAPRLAAAGDARQALEVLLERRREAARAGGALEDACVLVARVS
ncbi:PP2C family protein-serine/threonine phosphatase [Streptomyces lonarensis]|uniref:PP2C family protein-serine/threonine phosphatase n=2 Tax=Streptomyces lonarensis TaxID=700599 RepID=UPI0030C70B8F